MYEQFQNIEQHYYKLRGQFAVGRLTAEEFDAALRELNTRDAQGRLWMMGANSGLWYYSDGDEWRQGNPFQAGSINATHTDIGDVPPAPFGIEEPAPSRARGLALPFVASGIILLLVAGVAFFLFNVEGRVPITAAALPTRIVPPTVVAFQPTSTHTPTPTRTLTPRVTAPAGTTLVPITLTPPALVLEPTDPAPVLTTIPTITPGAPTPPGTPAPTADGTFADTVFSPLTPGAAQNSGLAPDVYVTDIRVSPNPPHQRQEITFTASFINTNPQNVGLEWRIVMLNPNKSGRNKDWGESQLVGITIPTGTSEFSLVYTPVTSGGPCVTLQALVARRLDDNGRFLLPGVKGTPFANNLTFC